MGWVWTKAQTAAKLQQIVDELGQAQRRLRDSSVDNLTFRKVFHAYGMARQLLQELDPKTGDGQDGDAQPAP